MGLAVETLSIALEKRYVGFSIVKEVDGSVYGNIQVSVGYYDTEANGNWLSVKESNIRLSNDNLSMIFSMKPSQMNLTNPQLVQSIDTVIYGIITGAIKTTASLHITIADKDGNPITGDVTLKRQGVVLSQFYGNQTLDINVDTVIGASVDVSAIGYKPFTKSYQILNGIVTLAVVLEALPIDPTPVAS